MKNTKVDRMSFQESDFATNMQLLDSMLFEYPNWQKLLRYKGISALDAGYTDFYWKFLEILRCQADPKWAEAQERNHTNNIGGIKKLQEVFYHIRIGEFSFRRAIQMIAKCLLHQLIMQLPPLSIPTLQARHKALVVRSFMNTSPFPILETLAAESDWQVLFASWTKNLEKPVSELGIPFLLLEETFRRKYTQSLKRHIKEVGMLIAKVDSYLPVKLISTRLGINACYDATSLIAKTVIKIRTYTDIYFELLSSVKPDIVILLNESNLQGRLMGLVSTLAGIPSITIQHGLFIGHVYHKLATDHIIVWGQEPKKFWEKNGCPPERIISVGDFAHDNWDVKRYQQLLSTTENHRPRVLFLGQNPIAFISPSLHSKTVTAVFQAIQALSEYYFIVKPHPGENPSPYYLESEMLQNKENFEIINGGSIEHMILKSDLVITVFSTAGLEAMLLGRPVLVLNLSNEPSLAPYVSVAELVTSAELLPCAIQKIFEHPEYRQSLVDAGRDYATAYFGEMDGQAVNRAVNAIKNLSIKIDKNRYQ